MSNILGSACRDYTSGSFRLNNLKDGGIVHLCYTNAIYVLGSVNPLSFSRGKRGIAGSLVFVVYDRAALYGLMQQTWYAQKDYGNDLNNAFTGNAEGNRLMPGVDTVNMNMNVANPTYPDQIPCDLFKNNKLGDTKKEFLVKNLVNCWDTLIAFLPQHSLKKQVRRFKKEKIGQSAAKLLSLLRYEEGSETKVI